MRSHPIEVPCWCPQIRQEKKSFHSTKWNSLKRNHNCYNSPRLIHNPLMMFTKPIVSTVALLLIQHYFWCVKPTVTDGNPAIIYCNSLCATKWKQLSQSTQRSLEQITTHNSLLVWEIYFLRLALSLCNSCSLQFFSSFVSSLRLLIICSSAFSLGLNPFLGL